MKKIFLLFTILCSAIILLGCEVEEEYVPSYVTYPELVSADEESDILDEDDAPLGLNVEFEMKIEILSENELSELMNFNRYDLQSEFGDNVVFSFTHEVSDFTLLGLDTPVYHDQIVIHSRHLIGPVIFEEPLVISGFIWPGVSFPRVGFSFVDKSGVSHYYHFNINAFDSELHWFAFEPADFVDNTEIPDIDEPVYHTVVLGDTLFSISQKYGVSIEMIQFLNALGEDTIIHTGQILYLQPTTSNIRWSEIEDEMSIIVARLFDEQLPILDTFNRVHEFTLNENLSGQIVIQTNAVIRDIEILFLSLEDTLDIYNSQTLDFSLLPGEILRLNGHESHSFPRNGISFTDENDQRQTFMILADQSYPLQSSSPYRLIPFN